MPLNKIILQKGQSGYSFKSEEKNDCSSLKKEILNNRIFEIRENTKQYNKDFSFWSTLAMAAVFGASDKKMFKDYINLPTACVLGLINYGFRPLVCGENYKKKTIETPLKKEAPIIPILSPIAAGAMICLNWMNDKLKTPKDKIKNIALAALVLGIGCLNYYVTSKNIETCENEISKLKSQLA